jgi:hypothetical protein
VEKAIWRNGGSKPRDLARGVDVDTVRYQAHDNWPAAVHDRELQQSGVQHAVQVNVLPDEDLENSAVVELQHPRFRLLVISEKIAAMFIDPKKISRVHK